MSKNCGPILSRLWTKVHEILGQDRESLVLFNIFARLLCHVLFRRYSPLSLEIVEKPNKVNALAPIF